MQMLKTILAEHPFFKGLDQSYLNVIVGCAGNVRFDSGDYISRQGEEADHFYLIRQGRVVLEAVSAPGQKPITIQTIGEGDVLGWSWLFPPYRWHLDARAVASTEGI
jgi:CRP/FNR family cyclic AMP-dependent transcriptional regulator